MKTKTIGVCGVDSGQLFITDPCYIKHQKQGNGEWNMEYFYDDEGKRTYKTLPDPTLENDEINFYSKVCEANNISRYGGAEVDMGVAFGTTHGDGEYAIEGIFDEDDVMVGIFIDMHGQVEGTFNYKEVW